MINNSVIMKDLEPINKLDKDGNAINNNNKKSSLDEILKKLNPKLQRIQPRPTIN